LQGFFTLTRGELFSPLYVFKLTKSIFPWQRKTNP
jgi:hypothetical protein